VASIYNAGLQRVMPRRPQWLANGYLSTLGDGLLDVAMVIVGGGFDSPFYFILFTVTLAAAMRYGYGPSLGVALLYVSADGLGYVVAQQPIGGPFVFRSLLLPLTAVLAGYLREQAQQAEAALQERLRQSNVLNEATAVLGASLELDAVLRAAVGATAQLFGTSNAVLQASSGPNGLAAALPEPIFYAGDGRSLAERALERMCRQYAQRGMSSRTDEGLITVDSLSTGQQAIVLELALPTRQISLATLAVAVPADASITLDSDILDSFLERITLAVENALTFDVQIDNDLPRVHGDRDRLHQVMANLLNNAMKFTRAGGTIVLRGEFLNDDEVRVSVSDTGIGVASADQERIFEKFQQVGDTLTDKPRGTGLGLAICRDIVEHHQGRMWIDSTPGEGSIFTVALPSEVDALERAA